MKKIVSTILMTGCLIAGNHPMLSVENLSEIAPGMGTLMMEYGERFWILYYAAKVENWSMVDYQLEEMKEVQEVGETTRPQYASKLKVFENVYLEKLEKAIESKNFKLFDETYIEVTRACNHCHKETGHGYIRYKLPERPPLWLDLKGR